MIKKNLELAILSALAWCLGITVTYQVRIRQAAAQRKVNGALYAEETDRGKAIVAYQRAARQASAVGDTVTLQMVIGMGQTVVKPAGFQPELPLEERDGLGAVPRGTSSQPFQDALQAGQVNAATKPPTGGQP